MERPFFGSVMKMDGYSILDSRATEIEQQEAGNRETLKMWTQREWCLRRRYQNIHVLNVSYVIY